MYNKFAIHLIVNNLAQEVVYILTRMVAKLDGIDGIHLKAQQLQRE